MKFLKNINWANVGLIAVVAVIAGLFIVPRVRDGAKKLPLVGQFVG